MRKSFPLKRTSISWGFWPLLLFFPLSFSNSHSFRKTEKHCASSCGPLHRISYPFRLKQDPPGCAISRTPFELTCEKNNTQPVFHLPPRQYYIQEISYESSLIHLLDPELAYSSLPLYNNSPSYIYAKTKSSPSFIYSIYPYSGQRRLVLVNCSQAVNEPSYVATAPCNLSSPHDAHVYAMVGYSISISQIHINCSLVMNLPIISDEIENFTSCSEIHELLMSGFYVIWGFSYPYSSKFAVALFSF